MLEIFLKIQENIRISVLKRRLIQKSYTKLIQKSKLQPEIKPMIENLQEEL